MSKISIGLKSPVKQCLREEITRLNQTGTVILGTDQFKALIHKLEHMVKVEKGRSYTMGKIS